MTTTPDTTPRTLLRLALEQWQDSCPGAGWEHHGNRALVSLMATPAMVALLDLASNGIKDLNNRPDPTALPKRSRADGTTPWVPYTPEMTE